MSFPQSYVASRSTGLTRRGIWGTHGGGVGLPINNRWQNQEEHQGALQTVYLSTCHPKPGTSAKKGTEDSVTCLLYLALQHLDSPGHFTRILFVVFSSTFDSLQKHLLIQNLHHLSTSPSCCPSDRLHLPHLQTACSKGALNHIPCTLITGIPQGCVLSPIPLRSLKQ